MITIETYCFRIGCLGFSHTRAVVVFITTEKQKTMVESLEREYQVKFVKLNAN